MSLLEFKGNHVASYQAPILNKIYNFKEYQIKVTKQWLQNKSSSINYFDIMNRWWSKGNFRSSPAPIGWKTYDF